MSQLTEFFPDISLSSSPTFVSTAQPVYSSVLIFFIYEFYIIYCYDLVTEKYEYVPFLYIKSEFIEYSFCLSL